MTKAALLAAIKKLGPNDQVQVSFTYVDVCMDTVFVRFEYVKPAPGGFEIGLSLVDESGVEE